MNKVGLILLFTLFVSMTVSRKKKIIFFGDSITQMGVQPGGYITRIGEALKAKGKEGSYELTGAGIGGNKVYDLYLRMEEDVLRREPDRVVIYIGINDVWHKTSGTGTDIEKFGKFYQAIIRKLKREKIRVYLCTPTVIGEKKNGANPQDTDLDAYAEVVRKLALDEQCGLVDLRTVFLKYEEQHNSGDRESGILTTDRVHLNDRGNQLVAEEIMKAMGW